MAASSSSSSSGTSSSSDRDRRRRRRRRRRDERGSLALKPRKSHRPRAKRRRRHSSSHDSSSCTAGSYRMDSQMNDPFATFLREEQGVYHDFVGSSPAEIYEFPNTLISSQSPVLISSRCSKQRGNFSVEDDTILVSGWLNTSLDAIIENEQKHKVFWNRYHAYFHQFKKPNSPERSMVSLKNRWSSIQQSTNKFCGFFAEIEAMHPSGTNIQDQIEMAKGMYREIMKSTFHFEHCWNILRHQPKWQAYTMYKERVKSKRMTLTSDSSSTSDYVERPLGKKAEKEIETKRKCKEISTLKTTEILTLMREDRKESHGEKMKVLHELICLNKENLNSKKLSMKIKL